MAKVTCKVCRTVFDSDLPECPNCGFPVNLCESYDGEEIQEEIPQTPEPVEDEPTPTFQALPTTPEPEPVPEPAPEAPQPAAPVTPPPPPPIPPVPQPVSEPVPEPVPEPQPEPTYYQQPQPAEQPEVIYVHKKHVPWIIWVLIVLLLAAGGAFAFLWLKEKDETTRLNNLLRYSDRQQTEEYYEPQNDYEEYEAAAPAEEYYDYPTDSAAVVVDPSYYNDYYGNHYDEGVDTAWAYPY